MRIALPLIGERGMMTVHFNFPGQHPLLEATVAELGMPRNCRFREQIPMAGVRYDWIGYEALHPDWVARFGMPPAAGGGTSRPGNAGSGPACLEPALRAATRGHRDGGSSLSTRADGGGCRTPQPARRWKRPNVPTPRAGASSIRMSMRSSPARPPASNHPVGIRFAIVLGETGETIGSNGLMDIDLLEGSAETETELWKAEHRSQGYGTEAKHLLLDYAFDHLGLHMIYSWISGFNSRSIAAIRKQGYRDAGYISWADLHGAQPIARLDFDLLGIGMAAARR